MLEVFFAFLKLGLTSFGGPIAHVGYFHREFVQRRGWLDEAHYAQLLAVAQFLPGPASSQVGFSVGLLRAGWSGGIAAFVAFTLPSALLMFAFANLLPQLDQPFGRGLLHGFKLVAVAVVAQGLLTMAQRLTPDMPRRAIAVLAAIAVIFTGSTLMQLLVVAFGGVLGLILCRQESVRSNMAALDVRYDVKMGALLLVIFAILLIGAFVSDTASSQLFEAGKAFYRAGALVFGGAHVVLPLLEEAIVVPGWISTDDFLAGYGAAQAVPGPMFSLAAFLGARIDGDASALGAAVSLLAMFLPGLLLMAGILPLWQTIMRRERAASVLAGINAAVVGLLGAALYDPVWTGAVFSTADVGIAFAAFILLVLRRTSVLPVIAFCVAASLIRVWLSG